MCNESDGGIAFSAAQSATEWATRQWGRVSLGDQRLNRRAVQIGIAMTAEPACSLPRQMAQRAVLRGAYRLLNHERITLTSLAAPHWQQTRTAAAQPGVTLFVQDTTELDYTHHPTKEGLGPIGNGRGRGALLHTTLAVAPEQTPQVLGVAHQKVVLRRVATRPRPKYSSSEEGWLWSDGAQAVGAPPREALWVHVGDGASDDFRFMSACRQLGKHFLVRVTRERIVVAAEGQTMLQRKIRALARSLPVQHRYTAMLPARPKQPARQAQLSLAWTAVVIPPSVQAPADVRCREPIQGWVLRIGEEDAPPEVSPVEWLLLTSLPTPGKEQALTFAQWYLYRWQIEEYHQCLKTGCAIEQRQLDCLEDIERLLGFVGPIAARLLQLRNLARAEPETPASRYVDPLTIALLGQRLRWPGNEAVTMHRFWYGVAQLGGHLGRRGDGPPGWKTIWHGWQYLQELVQGARLYAQLSAQQKPDPNTTYG